MLKTKSRMAALRTSTSGAAIVEYIMLMGLIGAVALFSISLMGAQISTTFEDTAAALSDPDSVPLPKGFGDRGTSSPGGNGGPVITDLDFGYLIDGDFCPETGYSWDWDPWGGFWTVPGTATQRPSLDAWRGGRVTSFDGPPEHTSRIPVPNYEPYNYWGDYIGITLFIWDTWEWTTEIPPDILTRGPSTHPMCDTYTLPDPNEGADPGAYAGYYPDPAGGEFLEGTPGVDRLDMGGGTYVGVIGYGRSDVILDTTGSDTIIPGGGNDVMSSTGGADTYVWAPGDGIDSYRPLNSGSGTDVLRIIGVTRAEASYTASGEDITIHLPNAERITLREQADNNVDFGIDEIRFDDGIVTLPEIYNPRVASLKSTGQIGGTNYPEHYFHTASTDGGYTITESVGTRDGDILDFTETSYAQAIFRQVNNGTDLQIQLPDNDQITIRYFISDARHRIDTIRFADGTVANHDDIIAAAKNQAKADGTIYGTDPDDNWTHTASIDGSYDIIGDQDGFDTLTFTETNFADARFSMANRDLFITLPDGDQIMAEEWNFNRRMIDRFVFADGSTYTPQQINDAALDHMKASGFVNASNLDDNHTHTVATDGSYAIQFDPDGTDKLTFTDMSFADARFRIVYRDLVITTTDGDTITVDDWAYNRLMIDTWDFMGQAITNAQVNDRAAQDAKASGSVEGTDGADNYYHTASVDGSYTIFGDPDGVDTLTFTETPFAQARFAVAGRDLTITTPDGDVILLDEQAYHRLTIDRWGFPDASPSQQEVFDRAAWDAKASGSVEASDDTDNFVHRASTDSSYTIFGDVDGTDSMTFQETSFDNIDFEVSGRDLLMRTPDGDQVRLVDFARYRQRMENFTFLGVSKTPQEVVDAAHEDGKARGAITTTSSTDNIEHRRSQDGSYVVSGVVDGNDTIHFTETAFGDATFTYSGYADRDLTFTMPDGDAITIIDYARYANYFETVMFNGQVVSRAEILARAN